MKKPDVEKLVRARLDPTMSALGFKWKRMRLSSDGRYVRAWDGGKDTFGFGIASYSPRYRIGGYATVRIDAVEEIVTPHVGFSPPEAAHDSWTCNVWDLMAFSVGPELRPNENTARGRPMVETEGEVTVYAEWLERTIREHIEPWWKTMRTAEAMWNACRTWRKFLGDLGPLTELALAFLCAPVDVQERLETECLEAWRTWPEMHRKRLDSLLLDLRERRALRAGA